MGQEKWKERPEPERKRNVKLEKTKANLPYLLMGPTSESEILNLEQKPAKCSNYRRSFDQFGLFI